MLRPRPRGDHRRGGGRARLTVDVYGNNLDTDADELAELIEALDLRDITVVGHSAGGGEVTRHIGRHGTSRVSKTVLISAVPPHVLDELWREAMQSGLKNSYECVVSLGETDFTRDLERFDVPTLLIHGDDDQVVP